MKVTKFGAAAGGILTAAMIALSPVSASAQGYLGNWIPGFGLQGFGSPGNYAEGFGHPTRIHPTLGTTFNLSWGAPVGVQAGALGLQGFGTPGEYSVGFGLPNDFTLGAPTRFHPSLGTEPYSIGVPYDSCCVGVPGVASGGYGQLGTGQYEPDMGIPSNFTIGAPYGLHPSIGGWPTAAVGVPAVQTGMLGLQGFGTYTGDPDIGVSYEQSFGNPYSVPGTLGLWSATSVGAPYDSCCVGVPGMTDGQVFGGVPSVY
jgi:hypothetical protein